MIENQAEYDKIMAKVRNLDFEIAKYDQEIHIMQNRLEVEKCKLDGMKSTRDAYVARLEWFEKWKKEQAKGIDLPF